MDWLKVWDFGMFYLCALVLYEFAVARCFRCCSNIWLADLIFLKVFLRLMDLDILGGGLDFSACLFLYALVVFWTSRLVSLSRVYFDLPM